MGVKGLSAFLRDKYPEVFELIHISEFAFKRIAIDTSLYLCNYKSCFGEEGWIQAFIKLVATLRENEIHCVFIYDTGCPPEKEEERKRRQEDRMKQEKQVCKLEEAIELYKDTGEVDPILIKLQESKKIAPPKSLLRPTSTVSLNINAIEYHVKKMRKQCWRISPQDFELTKQLFDILQVPYYNAPLEAETMCADLCLQGKVDAVLTEDTDVLAYGVGTFLNKINTQDGTCFRIDFSKLKESMGLEMDEILDFCIMCGTDYNKNIYRVGPVKAFDLIKEHKSIEKVKENTNLDISILNHVRGRELFRGYEKCALRSIPYCGFPDFNILTQFLFKKNIKINTELLQKSFVRKIEIVEDEVEVDEDSDDEVEVEEDTDSKAEIEELEIVD